MLSLEPISRAVIMPSAAFIDHVFNIQQLEDIIEYCGKHLERGKTDADGTKRSCDIAWISPHDDLVWLFKPLVGAIGYINETNYQFDLSGFDLIQYTRYSVGDHYGWHADCNYGEMPHPGTVQPRKLSISLVLNDGFEGGDFQINTSGDDAPFTLPMPKGRMIAFPSFMLHRVTPVTKGWRHSLVIWVVGPKFK